MIITKKYLINNPKHIFVFGDNSIRRGKGGGARFRYLHNTYGFITKRFPSNRYDSFYKPNEYLPIYDREIKELIKTIKFHQDRKYLISKLGSGLANKHNIFEEIIEPRIKRDLSIYDNVEFLF